MMTTKRRMTPIAAIISSFAIGACTQVKVDASPSGLVTATVENIGYAMDLGQLSKNMQQAIRVHCGKERTLVEVPNLPLGSVGRTATGDDTRSEAESSTQPSQGTTVAEIAGAVDMVHRALGSWFPTNVYIRQGVCAPSPEKSSGTAGSIMLSVFSSVGAKDTESDKTPETSGGTGSGASCEVTNRANGRKCAISCPRGQAASCEPETYSSNNSPVCVCKN